MGDELPPGIVQLAKVYIAQASARFRSATRWRGATATREWLPESYQMEDMPFLDDGTPVDIVLNPLGVPSPHESWPDLRNTCSGGPGRKLDTALRYPRF